MPLFVNSVTLAGNLTRDPETRTFENGNTVCNFSLAVNRKWKNQAGEVQEEVTFAEITCWNRTAELVGQYVIKGQNVYVEGELKQEHWNDQEGNKRSKLKILARQVKFLNKPNNAQPGNQAPPYGQQPASQPAGATPPPADLGDDQPPF